MWIDALAATADIESHPNRTLPLIIAELAKSHGSFPALLSDHSNFDFATLGERIARYARWASENGVRRGDTVALLMRNRPDYVAIWLGIATAGGVTALINTNLTGSALAHCIGLAHAKHAIVEDAFLQHYEEALAPHNEWPELWCYGEGTAGHRRIDTKIALFDAGEIVIAADVTLDDKALLIYTSGTTGLPKTAHISHRRIMNWVLWFKGMLGTTEADRMYTCLPLYHSVGGIVAVGATLVSGGSVVIAEKFSARNFWKDIKRWDCTLFQYIGELCRYLLNSPSDANETRHRLRMVCGNGLRHDVWEPFKTRFAIPQILEFYAATEGNFSLYNAEGKPGAIGRIPSFLRHRYGIAVVKHNITTGTVQRGADTFCVPVETGETGEAIGRIGSGADTSGRFEGYTNTIDSEKKILRSVFKPGDAWFRTGDIMRVDASGYYYFVDRIGDTFRWKGENVSTIEVESVIAACPGVVEAVVYGVVVPGADGRAGMAKLVVSDHFNLTAFRNFVEARLPAYALPQFLRIGASFDITETFKHKKQDLMREGFDPKATTDQLYANDAVSQSYKRIGTGS